MKAIVPSVKGTRDFYPEDYAMRNYLLSKIRKVSDAFGYQEYDGPFLEKLDLYRAKSGEELVMEQSYVFKDRGGEEITLRPELTPSLARMVAQRQKELVFPLRWWSYGPFWRYERPQKGRTREFFQWNIDLIGSDAPEADAEMIAIACAFFKEIGLTASMVRIAVNSRRLVGSELENMGVAPELRPAALRVMDRRDKFSPSAWEEYALSVGLTKAQFDGIKAVMSDPHLWEKAGDLKRAFEIIASLGYEDYVEFDPSVIRGLPYYTGLVFEAQARDGGRAIFGGGHYSNLVGDVGGEPLPGVGFAMGDVMITIVLNEKGLLPPSLARTSADALVTVFDEASLLDAYALSAELRERGVNTAVYPEAVKLQKQLKYADRIGVRYVLIAGPDERASLSVTIKDLQQRTQETVKRAEAGAYILRSLAEVRPV